MRTNDHDELRFSADMCSVFRQDSNLENHKSSGDNCFSQRGKKWDTCCGGMAAMIHIRNEDTEESQNIIRI